MESKKKLRLGDFTPLSRNEMKTMTGGAFVCHRFDGPDVFQMAGTANYETAMSWCNFWVEAGQSCRCFNE